MQQKIRTQNYGTKIGAFCRPTNTDLGSGSIEVNGQVFPEKNKFEIFHPDVKKRSKSVITRQEIGKGLSG